MVNKDLTPPLLGPPLFENAFQGDKEVPLKVQKAIRVQEQAMNRVLVHEILSSKCGGEVLRKGRRS